jgi:outer membrane protein
MSFGAFLRLLFLCLHVVSFAQEAKKEYSLSDAVVYGLKHNNNLQISKLEQDLNLEKMAETKAVVLPQVQFFGDFTNNIKRQTNILPGEIFGSPGETIAVQFGTRYTGTAAVGVSQKLVDFEHKAIMAAQKPTLELAKLNLKKTEDAIIFDIANHYISAQIAEHLMINQSGSIKTMDSLIIIMESQLENGQVKKADLSRLMINQKLLLVSHENLALEFEHHLLNLKFSMKFPTDSLLLIDRMFKDQGAFSLDFEAHDIELELLDKETELKEGIINQIKASYLPVVGLNANYGYAYQSNKANIFNAQGAWFPYLSLGLNLNLPIFDGNLKKAKVNQLKIQNLQNVQNRQLKEANTELELKKTSHRLQKSYATLGYQNQIITLTEELATQAKTAFIEGVGTLSDLLEANQRKRDAQVSQTQLLAQIKLSEVAILKLTGQLKKLNFAMKK